MSKTVLIAGASRGIGLEFAVQYAAEGWRVIACCRSPEQARGWLPADVDVQALDVTDPESVAALGWHLDDEPLDLLICNAGVFGPDTGSFAAPGDAAFDEVMHTNVLGPMRLIQVLAPSVAQAKGVIAVLSSKMGSIYETSGADALAYRCSKAASNMVVKAAANEYGPQGATVIALHPGWVRTEMGGPNALVGVSESVEGLRQVIADAGADDNGCFLDYTGRNLSW
ncbi:SDR family oxidoreductase [Uliginosibacterium sp. TH139]|uniref:SDR family oxidoreductase n=1 Tax=Uliginosibacterium sp. TH139 TaxID=2067453 RepID=UPI000C7DC92E|nr:SDR family oxidoreductase [Uliginosibacterium sp. TH139]PLK50743.1 short chain dehydrogenase [Uliginosibacterium sp. TH139]